ncbi:MAG TPA: hypothetical protein VKC60_03560, partial [Opitutaceae bacterium]|nr:hypothetical protein [Opitutaceae bacterium]
MRERIAQPTEKIERLIYRRPKYGVFYIVSIFVRFRRLFLASGILLGAAMIQARDIALGDNFDQVRAALGPPAGKMEISNTVILYYDRGQIVLTDGKVVSFQLSTPEQAAALQQRRTELKAEGEKIKAQKMADQDFHSAPYAYQVSFWEDFHARYPDVDIADVYWLALSRYQAEITAQTSAISNEQ